MTATASNTARFSGASRPRAGRLIVRGYEAFDAEWSDAEAFDADSRTVRR